ncbi:hypothetical protein F511_23978 [Dorcoceras hygrometricum]|uniref:Retrotransposon gag domain-containing protein n=1 Tax=Dorcoceras hygrometricum TaxID=472368 RepID=A0A2Z7D4N0_9LAMI|nr:hypothetical protein F511_23978 [Dorcoceras hygrometricum]
MVVDTILSVIPRGSWGDVARRFTMIRWAGPELWEPQHNGCGPTASCMVTQRMNPPTFTGVEAGLLTEGWLEHMEELFDAVEYSQERRLNLAVLQLREHAQRWWKGTSRVMRETRVVISWERFYVAFRQEYTPESFYNNRVMPEIITSKFSDLKFQMIDFDEA